jgi:multiple sugar transport system ATP-binding protein
MIAGLEDITEGELIIDGKQVNDLEPSKRGIAMVFQTYAIFPHMTVRENVAFGLTINKMKKAEKDAKVDEAARILQMEHLMDRRPSELSGGQRQRVAIGRAIVRDPKVFLFDEPLSNLDAALRMDMRMEIGKLHQDLGASMIYVTHDQVEAMTLADKIVVLKDGLVMQAGTPMELYHEPANLFVAGFLGAPSMNFLKVTVDNFGEDWVQVSSGMLASVKIPRKGRAFTKGQSATLAIRPQYLMAAQDGVGMLNGMVVLTERLGSETVVNLTLADGSKLIAAIAEDAVLMPGAKMAWAFDTALTHIFPE